MTEEEIKREARFMALERFACHTHNMVLKLVQNATGLSNTDVNSIEKSSLQELRLIPIKGLPPELSDILSDETFCELSRLIEYSQSLREVERD